MDARVEIAGDDVAEQVGALWTWLNDEDELRGKVSPVRRRVGETELGGVSDALTVVLSSAGVGAALSRSLITWLQVRRSNVRIIVVAGKRRVELEATNIEHARPLLEDLLRDSDET